MNIGLFRIWLLLGFLNIDWAVRTHSAAAAQGVETVTGTGCYTYGDDQTPALARRAALALAQEDAVRKHQVFVRSFAKVKDFQLEEDVVTTTSAGILQHVRIDKQEQIAQKICISISAQISPLRFEEIIQQKTRAKQVADEAKLPMLTEGSSFDLQLWTNKQPGEIFVEGADLEISVRANRDAFLKVDYYQADGTVVHLVPNLFVDEAFVRAGKTYTFGGRHARSGFRITGPFGAETIKAVASTHPLDPLLPSDKHTEESQGYLKTFREQMRGVKVIANPNQPAQWAETAFGLTTISKAALEHSQLLGTARGQN